MAKILIIEDNEMTIDIYKLIFNRYLPDITVEYINNAERGVERVTKNGFDILIVDFNLGHKEIHGMDLARLAYALGKPIIITSRHIIKPKFILYLKYWDMRHKVSFIAKPFKCCKLIQHIKRKLKQPCTPLNQMFQEICNF